MTRKIRRFIGEIFDTLLDPIGFEVVAAIPLLLALVILLAVVGVTCAVLDWFRAAYRKAAAGWTYDHWERLQLAVVIGLGLALIFVGIAGAANTHLAPTCAGPSLECFDQTMAALRQEVDGR